MGLLSLILGLAALFPAHASAAVSFNPATSFGAGTSPRSVAVGDFNGDTDPDLAVANGVSNNVSVLLGEAGGGFGAQTTYAVGTGPESVAVGDFNADTDPDLAVVNGVSNNVSVLLGGAGGGFGAATNFAVGTTPRSVAVGDFNGDTDPDLAVANVGILAGSVSVLLGGAGGSFGAQTTFAAGTAPRSVAVGDFNGDTDPDLAVANNLSGDVSVLLGGAGGSFGAQTTFAAGTGPYSVAVGDFNADTDPDLAVANNLSNDVSVLLGGAGGSFGAQTTFAVGTGPRSVAVGDLDGDTDPDLAVANNLANNVSVLLGAAGGSFGAQTAFAAGTTPESVAGGNFDADSDADLAVANGGSNDVSVLLQDSVAPETTIDSQPSDPSNSADAGFAFSANETATFQCKLDAGSFASCSSPQDYSGLGEGSHTFSVKATDPAGNEDPTPASFTWTIDTIEPATPMISGSSPASPANNNSPELQGSAESGSTVKIYPSSDCSESIVVQDGASVFASPGLTVTVANNSSTTFTATATDDAGNPSDCSSAFTYVEDSAAPATTIDSGPSGLIAATSASFTFSSEAGASFQCRLDSNQAADFDPCGSPTSYSSLAQGAHSFQVRAVDQAGNADTSPASRSFTVDTVAPQTTIDSGPMGVTNDPTPTFSFHSSQAGSSFRCKVNASTFTSCASPKTTSHLTDGNGTFSVRATDAAGNTDPTPALHSFTVRTAAVHVSGTTLVVTAAVGAKDNFAITRPSPSVLRVTDLPGGAYTGSGVHTWAGCTRSGDYTANCNAAGVSLIRVSSGVQTDQVVNSTAVQSELDGGPANDVLTGGSAADALTGRAGADVMKGMNGNDELLAHDGASDTTIDCDGGGADKAELDPLPDDSSPVGCETVTREYLYVALGDSVSAATPGFVGPLYSHYQTSLGVNDLVKLAQPGANSEGVRNGGQLSSGLAHINAASDTRAVTIGVGANDGLSGSCFGHWHQPNVCDFRENFAYILDRLDAALDADPGVERFTPMAYYNPASGTGTGNESSYDRGLLGINLSVGCSDSGTNTGLHDVIYQEAGELGIPVANPYPAFKQHGQAYISSDHLHPNSAGYAAIAQAFRSASGRCG